MGEKRFGGTRLCIAACVAVFASLLAPGAVVAANTCAEFDPLEYTVSNGGRVLDGPGHELEGPLRINETIYKVEGGTAKYTFRGVKYRVAKDSYFRPSCFLWHGKGPFPATELVKGRFKGIAPADTPRQGGMTREAIMGGAPDQQVTYTVKRRFRKGTTDGNEGITTLEVLSGGAMTLGTKGAGSCKAGQIMVVNWKGEVTIRKR